MKKRLSILTLLLLSLHIANGQKKVYFNNKKISDLGVNMGEIYGVEEFRPTFPMIWKDFNPTSDNYLFSGYYTLDKNSYNENKILNGEIKLTRLQFCIAEGTINLKEELTFNFINGNMNGPINYFEFSSECDGEIVESNINKLKWKKDVSISASYNYNDGNYKNINFIENRDWDKTKYSISQGNGYDISLDYFRTIININTSLPNEKPIFKKIKY